MNQHQGKRSNKKAPCYTRQFAKTEQNKARRVTRIARRKLSIPKPAGWAEKYAAKQAIPRAARAARSHARLAALSHKIKQAEGVAV